MRFLGCLIPPLLRDSLIKVDGCSHHPSSVLCVYLLRLSEGKRPPAHFAIKYISCSLALLLPPRVMSSETPLNFHPPIHQIVVLRSYTAVSTLVLWLLSHHSSVYPSSQKRKSILPPALTGIAFVAWIVFCGLFFVSPLFSFYDVQQHSHLQLINICLTTTTLDVIPIR
jgi:hypothetical protein